MANTANYGWVKPDVGGSRGTWGTALNTAMDAIDTTVKAVSDVASAALAQAGGVMTGRVDLKTSTTARQDKGSISGAQACDLAVAQYFTLTVGGALTLSFTNVPAGTFITGVIFRLTNGGSAAVTWPAGTKWASGVTPVLTAAGVDVVVLLTDDNGVTWRGFVSGKDLR